jgi:hypothetical protein
MKGFDREECKHLKFKLFFLLCKINTVMFSSLALLFDVLLYIFLEKDKELCMLRGGSCSILTRLQKPPRAQRRHRFRSSAAWPPSLSPPALCHQIKLLL